MCTKVTMLSPSSCWIFKHNFFNEVHDSMTFPITRDSYLHQWSNQVDLHMWLKYPTKWVYTFWLNYPTKWVYKFDQVLSWLNITILHHRSQHDPFKMTFCNKYQKDLKREIKFQNQHNANNASFPHDQCSPLSCASWTLSTASHQQQSLHDLSLSLNHKTSISSMCERKEYSSVKRKQTSHS